eukprot:Blabericola_migrator_1__5561@NODE_2831_length_2302_cov_83_896197_g1776_i0_p2_GENE_NODE_2831_length_2302_cov_83_896197_g1776_i0NODE_2831_length_2302_cov_83_896197_g1776_i0_p2_ORF_typecomplete_len144_score11_87_NODE_2831_length_2302_cov_83_896197_g1776_i06161047
MYQKSCRGKAFCGSHHDGPCQKEEKGMTRINTARDMTSPSFISNVCPSLQVPHEFEAGFINFTHFTRIGRSLDASAIRLSLQRQAAIVPQLADQAGYDMIIPILLGDEDDVIHDSNVGALIIQVKFRVDGGNPKAAMRSALRT